MSSKKVVHVGPELSRGGMSSVIQSLISRPPINWTATCVNTHSDSGPIEKIRVFLGAIRSIKRVIRDGQVDLAHIHVTHGVSWWRKNILSRVFHKGGIPVVFHIHSGRFEAFCAGYSGKFVKRELGNNNVSVVLLENRWKDLLSKWVPEDSRIIRNYPKSIIDRGDRIPGKRIELLLLSRESDVKGHEFAKNILFELTKIGVEARLTITGGVRGVSAKDNGSLELLGWVTENEKIELMKRSDFLLLPSKFEGSSMSVIEAICSGLPPVVSEASLETVEEESLVLSLDSPKEWAERIIDLKRRENYDHIIRRLEAVSEKYSPKRNRKKWGDLYDSIVDSNNSHGLG